MTVFVPVVPSAAQTLRSAGSATDVLGYADGPGLRTWLGDAGLDEEEVGYVALNHAGVAALLLEPPTPQLEPPGRRLVLAVDVEVTGQDALGAVVVPLVRWTDVRSLFADEDAASDAVAAARAATAGLDLGAALDLDAVHRLLDDHDLLWFAPEELDDLG